MPVDSLLAIGTSIISMSRRTSCFCTMGYLQTYPVLIEASLASTLLTIILIDSIYKVVILEYP